MDRILFCGGPKLVRQDQLRIGTWFRANQAFRGSVDELRLYGYARSEAEIAACCR